MASFWAVKFAKSGEIKDTLCKVKTIYLTKILKEKNRIHEQL